MLRSARSVLKNKKGVAALEYSILAGMIVLAIVGTLTTTDMAGNINKIFTKLNTALSTAAGTSSSGSGSGSGSSTNP